MLVSHLVQTGAEKLVMLIKRRLEKMLRKGSVVNQKHSVPQNVLRISGVTHLTLVSLVASTVNVISLNHRFQALLLSVTQRLDDTPSLILNHQEQSKHALSSNDLRTNWFL